jgi:hypothetical protein
MEFPTRVMQISSLILNKEYRIVRVEKVGDKILISFRDSPDYISQVFLTYTYIYCDEDLDDMNSRSTFYTLVYRGCVAGFHMLDIIKEHPGNENEL